LISKLVLGLFSVIILFQANQVYGVEELPIITLNFTSGNIIDLDESPQMIRADVQIQNYNPQDGYTYMEVTRVSDEEIVKDTEIFPKVIPGAEDNLFGVHILHYIAPGQNDEDLIGDYVLRIYSEYGSSEDIETFSIIKSSMPVTVTQNTDDESETIDESETSEDLVTIDESETLDESETPELFVSYDEYYENLEYQLATFCSMTDDEQLDFFSENPDMIEFDEELAPICEIEDNVDRYNTLDDSVDAIILELKSNSEAADEIPDWIHDIFVWYAEDNVSESELLSAIEYLISVGTISVSFN